MMKIRAVPTRKGLTPVTRVGSIARCSPFFFKSMQSRYSLPTLIVLLACTLLTALLPLLAASLSNSHDQRAPLQAQSDRQAGVSGAEREASQHQHDDGLIDENREGHAQGHSAVDHIHESLFAPPDHALVLCAYASQWTQRDATRGPGAHVATLERPPKPTPA
jgi:hypothetical protein